jgi:molybdate-binding protein
MINEKLVRLDRFDLVVQRDSCDEPRVDEFKKRLLSYIQSHGENVDEAELPARPDKL